MTMNLKKMIEFGIPCSIVGVIKCCVWAQRMVDQCLTERIDMVINCTPIRVKNKTKLTNLMI